MSEVSVPIPDEALKVLTFEQMNRIQLRAIDKAELAAGVEGAVEQACINAINAAAPFIARAAVVQELRDMAAEFDDDSTGQQEFADLPGTDDEGRDACLTEARVFSDVADRLRERADTLEATDGG